MICLRDQVWVQSLPLSHDDCCQLSHDRQPSTCISLISPLQHGSALWKHWSVGGCDVRLVNMLSCYVRVGNRSNLGTMRIRNFAPFLLITYSIQSVMHCIIFCPGECIEVTLLWDSSRSLSHWITFLYPKAAPKRNKKREGVSECPPRHRSTNYLATDFPPPPTS